MKLLYVFILTMSVLLILPLQTVHASNDEGFEIKGFTISADGVTGCNLRGNSKYITAEWDKSSNSSSYFFDSYQPNSDTADWSSPGAKGRFLWDRVGNPVQGVWKFQVRDYPDTGLRSQICTYTWEDIDGTGEFGTTTIEGAKGTQPDIEPIPYPEEHDPDINPDVIFPSDLLTTTDSDTNSIIAKSMTLAIPLFGCICCLVLIAVIGGVTYFVVRSKNTTPEK